MARRSEPIASSPDVSVVPLALEDVRRASPRLRLPGRNGTKAEILVYRRGDVDPRLEVDPVLKDYTSRPWWLRMTLGRVLTARETRAYRAAAGTFGLAPFLGRLGPWTLATGWIEAMPLARLDRPAGAAIFEELRRLVERLHGRGVALADLHHRDVLIDAGDGVHVVDLATAFVRGDRPGAARRRLFERLRQQDLYAVERMRERHGHGEAMPDERTAAWHTRGRALRRGLDRLRGRE